MQCSTLFSVFNGAKVIGICNGERLAKEFFEKFVWIRETRRKYFNSDAKGYSCVFFLT